MPKEHKPSFSNIFDDISKIQAKTTAPKRDKSAIDEVAEASGFTTRHAINLNEEAANSTKASRIDGRIKRRSFKTERINFSLKPEVDQQFRDLIDELSPPDKNAMTLGEVLEYLINFYKKNK